MRDIIFFNVMIFSPLYAVFIWTFFYPEKSLLWGKRWMFKEEPEISGEAIRYAKFASIIGVIAITLVVIISINLPIE